MFSIFDIPAARPGQSVVTRRELLRVGGLSLLGLTAGDLARLSAQNPSGPARIKSCIFVFLFGGPSHIDLWDMKPDAPAEIRGEFRPIATRTPGIQLCEHLPKLAQQTDKLCLLRSMEHRMPVHGPACSEMYTGRPYFGPPTTDQARPEDWPSLSALTTRFAQPQSALPPAVVLPWYIQFAGQDKRIAGQTGGRMGDLKNPFLVQGERSGLSGPGHPVGSGRAGRADCPPPRATERAQRRAAGALALRAGGRPVFAPRRHCFLAVGRRAGERGLSAGEGNAGHA
jgi:hypothetical protein